MMERLIDSPMPRPPGFVAKKALNSRSMVFGSIPTPASCMATSS